MAVNRRKFLKYAISTAASVSVGSLSASGEEENKGSVPYRKLGSTGETVSLLCMGGYHVGVNSLSEKQSITLMRTAVDEGINFFDNAWHYHGGRSERRMGKALKDGYREKVFLMTKHHGRTPSKAQEHLEQSMERLQVDTIDLWQFHELKTKKAVDRIYNSGVLDYVQKLKDRGTIRYIGFTGHTRPAVHKAMIERGFSWDTVQCPLNPVDYHYRSFTRNIVPLVEKKNMGLIAMKTLVFGSLPRNNIASARDCHRFAMSHPVSTICTGMESMRILKQNLQTVREAEKMEVAEMEKLLAKTRSEAKNGKHEWYK